MLFDFRLFHESRKPANAERAIAHMRNSTGADFTITTIEPDHEEGTLAQCRTSIKAANWEQMVYQTLLFVQRWGYSWQLIGSIDEELNLLTHCFHHGQGIKLAVIDISRSDFDL